MKSRLNKKLQEIEYSDIFPDPETRSGLDKRNTEFLVKLLGGGSSNLLVLISKLNKAETPYKSKLEKLAVDAIKEMYPELDEYGVKIKVYLGEGSLPPEDGDNENQDEDQDKDDEGNLINNDVAKRRLINAITQGASIDELLNKYFEEFVYDIDNSLLKRYVEVLKDAIDDLPTKYADVLKNTFGTFFDKRSVAMLLALLANQPKGTKGGESETDFDEDGDLVIRASGIIFPYLMHELIKGVFEMISLKQFASKDIKTNQDIVRSADKLKHEPEDMGYGTHIFKDLKELHKNAKVPYKVSFIKFLENIYEEDSADEFVKFITNLLDKKLTSSQKTWAEDHMIPNMDLSSLGIDEIKVNKPLHFKPGQYVYYYNKKLKLSTDSDRFYKEYENKDLYLIDDPETGQRFYVDKNLIKKK